MDQQSKRETPLSHFWFDIAQPGYSSCGNDAAHRRGDLEDDEQDGPTEDRPPESKAWAIHDAIAGSGEEKAPQFFICIF
jgi:hypothetical protein